SYFHHEIFWQFDPHNSTWIIWKHVDFHTFFIYPTWIHDESRGFLWIHVMWFVTGYSESLGKPWKALELFRFPQASMIYDVDFPVDFIHKKIPDAGLDIWKR